MNNCATAVAMDTHLLPNSSSNFSFSCGLSRVLVAMSAFALGPRLMVLRSGVQYSLNNRARHSNNVLNTVRRCTVKEVSLLCYVHTSA